MAFLEPAGPGASLADRGQEQQRGDGRAAARPAMLDTTTPECAQNVQALARGAMLLLFGRVTRRIFSRVMLGLSIPGRYYFITLTTTPTSPELREVWRAFSVWLHRYRPGTCWIYVFTMEGKGKGVIHMVVRLGQGEKRIDVKDLRPYWEKLTGARQLVIKPVREAHKEDLADYLANQKKKVGLGREFIYQSGITKWGWSTGWLPKGSTKAFARLWACDKETPSDLKERLAKTLIQHLHEHPDHLAYKPEFYEDERGCQAIGFRLPGGDIDGV